MAHGSEFEESSGGGGGRCGVALKDTLDLVDRRARGVGAWASMGECGK